MSSWTLNNNSWMSIIAGNSAMSKEADYVYNIAQDVQNSTERSQALFGEKGRAIGEVNKLQQDCAYDDWDGYGGLAIGDRVVQRVSNFIRALPEYLAIPDVSAEPDGQIALEWTKSRNKLLSVSIGQTNRLAFVWLDGEDHGHGVAVFDGEKISKKIIEGIQEVVR